MEVKKEFIIGCNGCGCSTGFGLCSYLNRIFDSLNTDEQKLLVSKAYHRSFKVGETIFSDGDEANRITILRSGKAKLNHYNTDGKEFILDNLNAGDIYGEQNLFSKDKYNYNCIALENTSVCELYRDDIHNVMMKNPEVGVKLLQILGNKYSNVSKLIEINSINDAKERLAGFLLYISKKENSLNLKMTRDEIASSINLRTETVSRKLNELNKEKIVKLQGQKNISIIDEDRLWSEYKEF